MLRWNNCSGQHLAAFDYTMAVTAVLNAAHYGWLHGYILIEDVAAWGDLVERSKFGKSAYLEDLEVGMTFYIPSRTQTEALFAAFQLASGDNHPIHYDVEYCKRRGYSGLLAHGFQTLIQTCPGASDLPHLLGDSIIAFIEQSSKFLKPVMAGDTLYPELTISALTPRRTTGVVTIRSTVHNQRNELCMEGEMKLLVKRRPVA